MLFGTSDAARRAVPMDPALLQGKPATAPGEHRLIDACRGLTDADRQKLLRITEAMTDPPERGD